MSRKSKKGQAIHNGNCQSDNTGARVRKEWILLYKKGLPEAAEKKTLRKSRMDSGRRSSLFLPNTERSKFNFKM